MSGAPMRLVGIFGDPVGHTRSPAMQNAAFRHLKLHYCYLPFAVPPAGLSRAVDAIRALDMAGVNVTIPHKERVMAYVDEVSAEARLIGAVNTIVNRRGRLIGHNTDGRGFLLAWQHVSGRTLRGRSICLLGAGGAARAVAVSLIRAGVRRLVIANRTSSRGARLGRWLRRRLSGKSTEISTIRLSDAALARGAAGCDGLINATAVGLRPGDARLVSRARLKQFSCVADLIYNPAETRLLADARAAGCRTMNGLPMLAYQGALAFTLWTGRRAPLNIMMRAIRAPR